LIEVQSKNGNGANLADKIMNFLKSSKKYLKLNSQGKVQIKAMGNGKTCYVFINSQQVS
jgi:hypothetical protein